MGVLSKWLKQKFPGNSRQNEKAQTRDAISPSEQLAVLLPPARGHCVLTPSTSQEDLLALSTPSSPFFARLPPEVREKIYLEAFGNRIVHIDLQHDHLKTPPRRAQKHADNHTRRDELAHKGWHWWSCVCNRYHQQDYFYDHCRVRGAWRESDPENWPNQCDVGVLGWLLTCRRAYLETIDLLYRSNTIHISATVLIYKLPMLIPSQRLSAIRSLELAWRPCSSDPISNRPSATNPYPMLQEFQQAFGNLYIAYPGLERLNISLGYFPSVNVDPSGGNSPPFESIILCTMDLMVKNYGRQLKICEVAVSARLESLLTSRNLIRDADKKRLFEIGTYWWRLRRTVDMTDDGSETLGYWIREGVDDNPIVMTCFGF